ncbi:hypothetical protein [Bacillus sp. FJAT-27245]|uniref:hypothetical protein n=1 Tax=Bacillus sp. FJAT-27245 TaxID=1684144 RepID=UPI0006A773C8|nr:hypothetical protein [Bacillus sp. FJAT-27245]
MDQEEFDSLKDKTGTLIEVDTKYIKIEDGVTTEVPEKEALIEYKKLKDKEKKKLNGDISIQAEIGTDVENTSWMQLLTTVSTVSTGVWQVKNSFNWWTEPVWTLEDAIGISHPEYQTPDMNSERFTYTYDRHTNNTNLTYVSTGTKTKSTADDKNSNGMAFKYDIIESEYVNGTKYLVLNHRGKMYYDFRKASSQYTRGAVYGHYTHTEMGIVGSIGVKISLNSLSVSGAAKQTKMTDTGVSFSF